MITIKDVALKAGVSVATASRAISGNGYVRAETRERVTRAARELEYTPHDAARSLKRQRTKTVGLMITDIVNPFYAHLADGVLVCARRLGYNVILCATDEDRELERTYLNLLMEKRVDGFLAVPTGQNRKLWQKALELGSALVLIDRAMEGMPEIDVVMIDNHAGARAATRHLLELGHRRIGIIAGPHDLSTGNDRLEGYSSAHREFGVPTDEALIQVGSFKRDSGITATEQLLSLADPPTAIFATNNVLGEAAMHVLRNRGLKVPEDISLVMFDDVSWASLTSPRLTVVAQPTYNLGYIAMERLVHRLMDEDQHPPLRTGLQPELIVRESCAPRPRK